MKYVLGLVDGRNEPIKGLNNAKRPVLVNKDTATEDLKSKTQNSKGNKSTQEGIIGQGGADQDRAQSQIV